MISNIDEFQLVDSHIHLSASEFDLIRKELCYYLKITKTLAFNVSETLQSSMNTLEVSTPNMLSFVGIHPKYSINSNLDDFMSFFKSNQKNIDGIGEIGLDKTYVKEGIDFNNQVVVFKFMLELAEKFNLPVSIHSRDATQEVLDILSSYDIKCIMLHWFSGTEIQLKQINNSDKLISFGPALVYSKSMQRLAKSANPDLTITETDGPVYFSACYQGKMAEPCFIPSIINTLNSLWNIPFDDVGTKIINNLKKYIVVNNK